LKIWIGILGIQKEGIQKELPISDLQDPIYKAQLLNTTIPDRAILEKNQKKQSFWHLHKIMLNL